MSNKILVNTSTISPLADAVRTATGATNTMSAAETIAKSTTIVENGGSAVASVNGKIGVVELNYTDVGAPPSSRTINGKSLEEDITLTAQDVGALTTEDIVELETQVTTNTTAIGTLDSRTSNCADAIMALQNEVDEHILQSEMMFLQRDRVPNLLDNSDFSIWFGGAPKENVLTIAEGPTKWKGNGNLYRTYSQISKGCRITATSSGTYIGIAQQIPANRLHIGAYTIIWNFTTSADCISYKRNAITANTPTTEIVHITITDEHITQGYYSLGSCGIYALADGSNIPEGFYFDIENVAMYEGTYTLDNYPTYIKPNIRLEAIKCGVPMNPRNLLDNSWFANPINQRGAVSVTTGWTYFIDRWLAPSASEATPISLNGSGLTINNAAGTSTMSLRQYIANMPDGVYTAAAKCNGNLWTRQFTLLDGSMSAAPNHSDSTGQLYISGTGASLAFNLQVYSGKSGLFEWAALYEGAYTAETLPAYQYKGYAVELAECMRYYIQMGSTYNAWNEAVYIKGWGVVIKVPLATKMRISTPTVETLEEGIKVFTSAGWSEAATITSVSTHSNMLFILISTGLDSSLITAGNAYLVSGIKGIAADL